jgi:hypothetical protein
MTTRKELIEKLLKIKALAENGDDGEKENAKQLLISLMDKYGFKDDDLGLKEKHYIKYNRFDPLSEKLLHQVVYSVLGKNKGDAWRHKRCSDLGFVCTKAQAIEIEAKYNFYYNELKNDMKILYHAFIMKNSIYPPQDEANESAGDIEITSEDRKAYLLSMSLDTKQYYQQLKD